MARNFPGVPFERFADDAVVHCVSKRQARQVLAARQNRMVEVGLRLHPDKTRVVYCQDANRRGSAEHTSFTFLGYTFRARGARNRNGVVFTSFLPAVSKDALTKMGQVVRRWRLHRRTDLNFADLARMINPIVRGWMNCEVGSRRGGSAPFPAPPSQTGHEVLPHPAFPQAVGPPHSTKPPVLATSPSTRTRFSGERIRGRIAVHGSPSHPSPVGRAHLAGGPSLRRVVLSTSITATMPSSQRTRGIWADRWDRTGYRTQWRRTCGARAFT